MKRLMLMLAVLALAGAAANGLAAQVRFGGQLDWGDDTDLGVGARLEYAPRALFKSAPVFSAASFDFFFPGNDVTYLEINYNIFYQFVQGSSQVTPYAGGGLNFAYASVDTPAGSSSDSELGLNLGGGVKFKTSTKLQPFVEARFELSGGEQFVITGGLIF
jgi:opacity protein-like surface antigen